ncbi:hypothetical protein ACPC54_07885 [Kitasatospora sp. NPDC094028]
MGTNTVSPDELAALVDRLRWDKRRHPYHGRGEYQAAAHQVLETATVPVDAGRAGTVVRTLRTAVDRVTRALMHLDDSSGIVGDALQELTDLYARALEQAPPANPNTLASWLVAAHFDGPDWPRIRLRAFAPALGDQGIAVYASPGSSPRRGRPSAPRCTPPRPAAPPTAGAAPAPGAQPPHGPR